MTSTTRVPAIAIDGVYGALVKTFSKKMFGKVPDSLGVMWHHKPALKATMALGQKARTWHECEADLKSYAHMATAAMVGCSFCLDLNYFMASNEGLDVDKAREIPRWRESDLFSPIERDVLEYAEAMTATPPTVTDELSGRLLAALGAAGLLELTSYVGMANMMARGNVALGIESEGLAASCGLRPMAEPAGVVPSAL